MAQLMVRIECVRGPVVVDGVFMQTGEKRQVRAHIADLATAQYGEAVRVLDAPPAGDQPLEKAEEGPVQMPATDDEVRDEPDGEYAEKPAAKRGAGAQRSARR